MQLDDIDWVNGCIVIRAGKTHRERTLPLAQDVGEGLLSYLRDGRPPTTHRDIFLEHGAPFRPLKTSSAITLLVKRLLSKADINRKPSGAHLLRHARATELVNHGASFKDNETVSSASLFGRGFLSFLNQFVQSRSTTARIF